MRRAITQAAYPILTQTGYPEYNTKLDRQDPKYGVPKRSSALKPTAAVSEVNRRIPSQPSMATAIDTGPEPANAGHAGPRVGPSTLLLPLNATAWVWSATAALFAYYAFTMARDLSLYDSSELAVAAVQLGLGHPPGQPLHTLFGFALAQLPLWPPIIGVALASALPAALTLVPATSLAQALARSAGADPRTQRFIPWLIAAVALHASLWEPATRVEVYALATFLAVWAFARVAVPESPTAVRPGVAQGLQAGLALGLCASANPMIALCAGLACIPGVLLRFRRREIHPLALPAAVGGLVLGLSPYAYVLLVVHRTEVMVWGAPRDLAGLVHYFGLRDYAHNQELTLPMWLGHFGAWVLEAMRNGLAAVIALGAFAHFAAGRSTPLGRVAGPLLLVLLVSVVSFNVVWNLDVPDYDGYTASGLWLMAAGFAALAVRLPAARPRIGWPVVVLTLTATLLARPQLWERTRHRDQLARRLAEQVLREAPAGAIVIAEADHIVGPLFYLQEVEHARPDAVVLAYGLASSSWHWERLYRLHPTLQRVALRGSGGRAGRVRRFLAQNAARPVIVESLGLANQNGLAVCPGGLFLRTGAACDGPSKARPQSDQEQAMHLAHGPHVARLLPTREVTRLLREQLSTLGRGSPSAEGAIAAVAFNLGESLWRLGHPRIAHEALLAGVSTALLPASVAMPPELAHARPLMGPLPAWREGAALGDPRRNLFVAAMIHLAASRPDTAEVLLTRAAQSGLPEAQQR